MNWFRISKYNPAYRNSKNEYELADWTSFSDIGKMFNGYTLTWEDYIKVENQYINLITCLFYQLKVETFFISEVEIYEEELIAYKNNDRFNIEDLTSISVSILRENMWCKIHYQNDLSIHFGYDYYMYVGLKDTLSIYIHDCVRENNLLFLEQISTSPYKS